MNFFIEHLWECSNFFNINTGGEQILAGLNVEEQGTTEVNTEINQSLPPYNKGQHNRTNEKMDNDRTPSEEYGEKDQFMPEIIDDQEMISSSVKPLSPSFAKKRKRR